MINIVNRRTYRGEGVYIGRPSLLGNPFQIGRDGTREDVIATYRVWLWRRIEEQGDVYRELHRLAEIARRGDLNLICWCKRQGQEIACHGDVLKASIAWINAA